MHEPVPPELVDMIIDKVGGGHMWVRRPSLEEGRASEAAAITHGTLKNCALVARSWTHRSRKRLFNNIGFTIDEEEGIRDLVLPSADSLKLVEFLTIYLAPKNLNRDSIILHLLTAFSVCPLESLHIEGGLFTLGKRSELHACFDALVSSQLLDLTFRFCSFEPEPLRDILAIENTGASITFLACDQDHPEDPTRDNINWQSVRHHAGRMLCVMGSDEKPSEQFLIDLSVLSVQSSRLDVDFFEDGDLPDATQRLIDANAGVVSFLRVNMISYMNTHLPDDSEDSEVLLPPSLALCANLSELVLNMKGSYSCIVDTPGTVLATLLEANCSNRLSKITVEVEGARAWFLSESRKECAGPWKNLDTTLSTLALRSTIARNKKLVFVMEVTCTDDTIHRAKKWLPRFLPRFHEEGLLHVHDGEDDVCRFDNYDLKDKRACMGKAVLKKYKYESESDEETEEVDATKQGKENKENQEGEEAKGSIESKRDEESDEGNEGDSEGEEEES